MTSRARQVTEAAAPWTTATRRNVEFATYIWQLHCYYFYYCRFPCYDYCSCSCYDYCNCSCYDYCSYSCYGRRCLSVIVLSKITVYYIMLLSTNDLCVTYEYLVPIFFFFTIFIVSFAILFNSIRLSTSNFGLWIHRARRGSRLCSVNKRTPMTYRGNNIYLCRNTRYYKSFNNIMHGRRCYRWSDDHFHGNEFEVFTRSDEPAAWEGGRRSSPNRWISD